MSAFTNRQLYLEARREYKLRIRVYGRWLVMGRMTRENHDAGIEMMRQIMEHFRKLAEAEDSLPGLFSEVKD